MCERLSQLPKMYGYKYVGLLLAFLLLPYFTPAAPSKSPPDAYESLNVIVIVPENFYFQQILESNKTYMLLIII